MTTQQNANFAIGQLIHHRLFDYRGVVVDVDAQFQGSEEWYERHSNASKDTPPKDEPWYHVLIDEEGHVAYVAQRNLEPDNLKAPVEHPLLNNFFKGFKAGQYQTRHTLN
ncbi:MAG: heat shock protein HspQ [Thiofilum sp.]|uniref:heat shock protein HspQ n=1 Tax=Thiofilum sp. TaxID=2212733 RepID=UPI0025F22F9E|nr:heat shock protein HspQ [Thiofilum sp.]MBK8452094.1 heat shock protein HspQ [Thiofilum sp.]